MGLRIGGEWDRYMSGMPIDGESGKSREIVAAMKAAFYSGAMACLKELSGHVADRHESHEAALGIREEIGEFIRQEGEEIYPGGIPEGPR